MDMELKDIQEAIKQLMVCAGYVLGTYTPTNIPPIYPYKQMANSNAPAPRSEFYTSLANGLRRLAEWLSATAEAHPDMKAEGVEKFVGAWRGQQVQGE